MKIIASIQARLNSSRLPKKVLKNIFGKPMLYWQVERIKKSLLIDDIIIATSNNDLDDEIENFCKENKIICYRGSENDVLDRISSMIKDHNIDIHVELFGDSPLVDPMIIDQYVGYFLKNIKNYDFISNSIKTTYPPGQEVLVYKGACLIDANKRICKDDPLREHVSIHIYKNTKLYKIKNIEAPTKFNYPSYFLEVDTPTDFIVIESIFNHFLKRNNIFFSLDQIISFLKKNPDLIKKNQNVNRRWKKYRKDEI